MSTINRPTIGGTLPPPKGGLPPGTVKITTTDGRHTLTALIGTSDPDATEGRGGWSEVQRPRRPAAIEWIGAGLAKGSLPLLLDAYAAGGTIGTQLATIDAMAPLGPSAEPPAVKITGGWPIPPNIPFVIQSVTWGQRLLRTDGQVARAEVTLELLQQTFADVVVKNSPAKSSATRNGTGNRAKARTVTAKKGDTLASLAAKYLGASGKWTVLAKLNKIRDPNHLKAGQKIKLS